MPSLQQFIIIVDEFPIYTSFIKDAVALYFCMNDDATPVWKQRMIAAALGSAIGTLGLTSALVAGAKYAVGDALNEKHYRQASEFLGW